MNNQDITTDGKFYRRWTFQNELGEKDYAFIPSEDDRKDRAALYLKISKVTGQMKRVQKNSRFGAPNSQYGYNYASWDDIAQALNEVLGEVNLAVIPHMPVPPRLEQIGTNSNGNAIMRAHVQIEFTIVDGDTGAMETRTWYGHADDNAGGEKVIPKAITYTQKTFYKSLFVISTGDEDAEGSDVGNTEGASWNTSQQNKPPAQQQQRQNKQQNKPPAQQQTPPKQEPQPETQQQSSDKATDINSAPKDIKLLLNQSEKQFGMSRDDVKFVLAMFDFPKDAKGQLVYKQEQHDNMLAALKSWKDTHAAFVAAMGEDAELPWDQMKDWLHQAGLKFPTTQEALSGTIPRYQSYMAFLDSALEIEPEFAKVRSILEAANALPWSPEKNESLLQILRSAKEHNSAKDEFFPEEEQQNDPFAGDADPVNDDELGDMLTFDTL